MEAAISRKLKPKDFRNILKAVLRHITLPVSNSHPRFQIEALLLWQLREWYQLHALEHLQNLLGRVAAENCGKMESWLPSRGMSLLLRGLQALTRLGELPQMLTYTYILYDTPRMHGDMMYYTCHCQHVRRDWNHRRA